MLWKVIYTRLHIYKILYWKIKGIMSDEKKTQTLKTMKWLEENYCPSDVCLPREMVYEHYLDFCLKNNMGPIVKATFGKLIRNKFPGVTSKRLGTRGHSKYHYHGIGMKQNNSSHTINNINGWTRFSGSRSKIEKLPKSKSSDDLASSFLLSSKFGTLIPKFPEACELNFHEDVDEGLLQVFLTMYKMHCQCIVDSVISENFGQIEIFLFHFWHGLPDHLLAIMNVSCVEDIIVNCDWILYKTLLNILFPTTIQKFPDTLLNSIYSLGCFWIKWLRNSLENFAPTLLDKKLKIGKLFAKSLRRHLSVIHAAQILSPYLCAETVASLLSDDFYEINSWIINTVLYATHTEEKNQISWCINVIKDLQVQLQDSSSIESLIATVEYVINKELSEDSSKSTNDILNIARSLVLKCNYLFARLCQWLTLKTSDNFVLFHFLLTFLHEYQLLIVETLQEQKQDEEIYAQTKYHLKPKLDAMSRQCFPSPVDVLAEDNEINKEQQQHEGHCQRHSKRRRKTPQSYKRKRIDSESSRQNKAGRAMHVKLDTSQHLLLIKAMSDNLASTTKMVDHRDNKQHQKPDFSSHENEVLLENTEFYSINRQESQHSQMEQEWHSCAFQTSKHAFNESNFNSSGSNWNQYTHLDDWFPTPDVMANVTNSYHPPEKDYQKSNSPFTAVQDFFETETLQEQDHASLSECHIREQNSILDIMTCYISL